MTKTKKSEENALYDIFDIADIFEIETKHVKFHIHVSMYLIIYIIITEQIEQ